MGLLNPLNPFSPLNPAHSQSSVVYTSADWQFIGTSLTIMLTFALGLFILTKIFVLLSDLMFKKK